ncbi:glycoside hydrolase family 15 protein [Salinarimonas soli]|nr:glycoside hydrolase family 15 protein [Salinarimonas soli]
MRIEDYALIGDCETVALVGRNGSIDWLCWPRFDSDAAFAALLGREEHGRWLLAPREPVVRSTRAYRDDTLVLETRFETAEGAVTLVDFMPPRGQSPDVVRLVRGEHGRVAMRMELVIRFGYGADVPWVTRLPDGALRAVAGPDMTVLRTPVELRGEDLKTVADFTVEAGEVVPFVLSYGASHGPLPRPIDVATALDETERFWRGWVAQSDEVMGDAAELPPAWSTAVRRSLMVLKALTYAPTGGIVAAATTSLPEAIGGVRNWDYRFCWLRDATLSLLALMNAGYYQEARAWRDWLVRAIAGSPDQMRIMYGLAGERRLTEWTADWLPGYEGSAPVRIGNAAHSQRQLDVYGQVMDALHQARCGGLPEDERSWAIQRAMLNHLSGIWREPDQGIWEVRGEPQHFVHSKVMAWVAFDRGIRSAEAFGLDAPVDDWRRERDAIHEQVCARGYDPVGGTFVRSYGASGLDASLLLLPAVGFLTAGDPRIRGTVEAVEERLCRDGLLLRYDTQESADGLPVGEGAFLACSFWLVDAYRQLGRIEDARALFDRLVGLCNDVGLLSEEYDARAGRLLGNMPQAFSHVALIISALNLSRGVKPAEQRSYQPLP